MKKAIFGLTLGALLAMWVPVQACTMAGCGVITHDIYDYWYPWGYTASPSYSYGYSPYSSPSYSYYQQPYYSSSYSYPQSQSYPFYQMMYPQQYSYSYAYSYGYGSNLYPFAGYQQPYWGW